MVLFLIVQDCNCNEAHGRMYFCRKLGGVRYIHMHMNCQFDTSHIIDIPFESRSTSFDFSLLLLYFLIF
jgi:hypothetical protein